MSELGSNKGQDENKNAPVFDSANLAEKQNTEHFTKIEGAEERKKAAAREAKAAEKRAEEAHKEAVKNAAKKSEKEAGGSKGGILNFLFGGWHKWVIAIMLVLILVGSLLLSLKTFKKNDDDYVDYKAQAEQYYQQQRYVVDIDDDSEGFISARELYKERIGNTSNEHEKFYEQYYYSLFLYFEGISIADAASSFSSINIPEEYTNEEVCDLERASEYFSSSKEYYSSEERFTAIGSCEYEQDE